MSSKLTFKEFFLLNYRLSNFQTRNQIVNLNMNETKIKWTKIYAQNWYLVRVCFYELTEYIYLQKKNASIFSFNLSNILGFIATFTYFLQNIICF